MNFQKGDTFKNVHMPEYDFRVDNVDVGKNKLEVCITGPNESRWFEDWNLEHTETGFKRMEYHTLIKNNNK